jgi:diguanylate cyclase
MLNRDFGREAGDRVLAKFEKLLKGSVPKDAVAVRIAGDEFAAALPGHSSESALIIFEEIRDHIANKPSAKDNPEHIGVSIGIASRPPHATEPDDLLGAASEALMRAKREGRNRVRIYVEEKMVLKSNYYPRATLERLAKASYATGRTEASILREALDDVLLKYRDQL